ACRGSSSSVSVSSSSSTGRPSDNVIIVDDLDAAPGFTFSYPGSNKFERSNGFRWHSTVGGYWRGRQGANELRATFRFAGVPAGRWKLFATWAKHAGDVPSTWNTRVKYYVDGNVNVAEMLVDQRSDPVGPDLVGDGTAWQSIGSITMDGRPIDVVLEPIPLQYEEGGMIMADAVAMVRDGGGGTSAISSWMPSWLRRWFSP
ncbi:hypothetical protein HYT95_00695, partial [Candidatus Peregrinibacteria bacterium]|nr:hypothetical protein [Candidatus Peregrinibacteria bacterium]